MAEPTKVAVLGLGRMGSRLAEAFLSTGQRVSVWNRDPAKCEPFDGRAAVAASAAEAVAASELVIVCVADYAAASAILEQGRTAAALRGRALAQLSSGSPEDARALGAWASGNGVEFLDGAILTYPDGIGPDHPDTVIFYSGSRAAFDRHRGALLSLGGRPTFVGEAVGGAAAADLAWLSFEYGATAGLLQGAAFCEAENVDPGYFFDAVNALVGELSAAADRFRAMLRRGEFHGDLATLDVHVAAIEHIVGSARSSGISPVLPAALLEVFGEAARAGHGDEEIAAAIETFRGP